MSHNNKNIYSIHIRLGRDCLVGDYLRGDCPGRDCPREIVLQLENARMPEKTRHHFLGLEKILMFHEVSNITTAVNAGLVIKICFAMKHDDIYKKVINVL